MEVLHTVFDAITGHHQQKKIEGKVVLMKKNVLDFNDFNASVLDRVHELVGKKVSLQLISASHGDPKGKELKGKLGKKAYLEDWVTTLTSLTAGDSVFDVTFDWEEDVGVPGAFLIRNSHHSEFFLKSLTLEDVPGQGRVHFVCNSWVYPADKYKSDRVFFVNQTYLPGETPAPLLPYRKQELVNLRGNGTGKLEEWDRVYDYAYYNDLGDAANPRPVLGGSAEYPYPRRGRTGRPPIKEDPKTESRIPLLMSLNIYVPRDERFGHLKLSDFLGYALKSIVQFLLPEFKALCDSTPNEFDSFGDTLELYKGGFKLPEGALLDRLKENIPLELLKELVRTDGEGVFKFPMPQVIQADETAWRTDEEFGREMLSGVNPVSIRRLEEFPPLSKLDSNVYGNQHSSMNEDHIKNNLDGLTKDEALKTNRLFILDHHDALMPYLRRINTTSSKIYATRTVLFLQKDGTLKPLAIELSLPHPDGDKSGTISEVYTPPAVEDGVQGWIWQFAKAYVAVNDSGVHQLISHWLNTHAVIEPFVIATNRQLSVLHPIHKLLHPHFRDTMNINGFARQTLINGGGILEKTVFPGKYAMELSSAVYKNWVFTEQGLPADLIKRGMAVKDVNAPHGLRLLIEDYPYAVDGLKIWSAIETWVREYCNIHYKNDETVQKDTELQSWWNELKEEGHGDKKNEPWWPKMQTLEDLIESCTITIWVASALHAAVNFGQYPYAGYLPNRPTVSRRFMPKQGTPEYVELMENPEKAFLKTITAQLQTLLGISLIEILSRHSSDEVYLGQRDTPEWTTNEDALAAFGAFGKKLGEIEDEIVEMNNDRRLKNRVGPAKNNGGSNGRTTIRLCTVSNFPGICEPRKGSAMKIKAWRSRPQRSRKGKKIRGIVVLVKKNVLDFNDFNASFRRHIDELIFFLWESFLSCFGKQFLSLQLSSADRFDLNGNTKRGKKAYLKSWLWPSFKTGDSAYVMTFDWDEDIGFPGAFTITNDHQNEFFLKSLTLLDVPGHGRVHFVCNSWVYPAYKYNYVRNFFVNKTCLPSETPKGLTILRISELENLRGGSGTDKKLQEWDRVYDYACYNDLGGDKNLGPVLGGSEEHPYPRRGKTGRPIDKDHPGRESRISLIDGLSIYVPRDERFGHLKLKDFLGYALNSLFQVILARIKELKDGISPVKDIKTFNELKKLSIEGFELPKDVVNILEDEISLELLQALSRTSVEDLFKFPIPQVIQARTMAWKTDEEFGREMLSGANPVSIRRLESFPPTSKLDAYYYGDQTSSIKEHHIKKNLEGESMTIVEALEANRLFILDHHDALMPYVRRINATTTKIYATRTVLFLQKDGTLKPLAIELSLPHPHGDQFGAISEVHTPPAKKDDVHTSPAEDDVVQGWIWQFAKAYVAVNDSGVHQLISHWLNTHAVMEPFVIATNRQLSVMHPIHKLLHPHFRDTMNINAFARQTLISRGGVLERTVFPGEFAMELSSDVYKSWVFTEQGLPADLLKRGMAVKDGDGSLRLLIEDYPYAVDGLKIWSAIEKWVLEYCKIYYKTDETVQKDTELQSWWKELKEKGHGDKKHEPWWPKMQTLEDLTESCTIIIWVASALHAAVNFGQYAYGGYALNRPTMSLALMPTDYNNLKTKPEEEFLDTFTCQLQTLIGVSLIEILSKHTSDEVYLGQRDSDEWTTDKAALDAFATFGKTMETIEGEISRLNKVVEKKNRVGPVEVPYTLLYRTSGEGLTGKGIPNSVSI